MADPFNVLGSQGVGAPALQFTGHQQQSATQLRWPGVNPAAGSYSSSSTAAAATTTTSVFAREYQQAPHGQHVGGFHPQEQHNMQTGTNSYHTNSYPGGQQQQFVTIAAAMSWSGGGGGGGGMNAAGSLRSGGWNPNPVAGGPYSAAPEVATPHPAPQMNTSADGWGVAGAEWIPPPEQLQEYDSMFRSASAGGAVPGTVSGRAAVQFFSRSGLPKDVLKTIWSVCDPALTGSICRPRFFAAMRLIALAQQGPSPSSGVPHPAPLPSLSALEATRNIPLPLPRMSGFPPSGVSAGTSGWGLPPVPAAVPPLSASHVLASPPLLSSFQAAAASAVGSGGGVRGSDGSETGAGNATAGTGAAANSQRIDSLQQQSPFDEMMVAAAPAPASSPATVAAAVEAPASDDEGFGEFAGSQETPAPGPSPIVAVVKAAAAEASVSDDEDFGEFAGSQEGPKQEHQQPTPPVPSTNLGDSGDDFGEFSGAPSPDFATAATSPAELFAESVTSSVATERPTPAAPSVHGTEVEGWMSERGGAVGSAVNSGNGIGVGIGGGLDNSIESNLLLTAVAPVNLADMQPTPPTMEELHNPVMVDRASVARSKLAVFDAMVELDLAVQQEEWSDFADETTAPPRSPTPPPPPRPSSASAEGEADFAALETATGEEPAGNRDAFTPAIDGAAEIDETPHPPALPRERSLESDGAGQQQQQTWPDFGQHKSPTLLSKGVEVSARAPVTQVSPAPEPPDQDDDWGDFEDAAGGGGESSEETGQETSRPGDERTTAADEEESAPDDGQEWGTFSGVPEGAVEAAGEEGGAATEGARRSAGSTELPEDAVDPFAEIATNVPEAAVVEAEGELGAATDSCRRSSAGSPQLPKDAVDPFAGIAPETAPRPPSGHHEGATAEEKDGGIESEGGSRVRGSSGASETTAVTTGLPMSLRGLRDSLAKRGRLEEANEVQQRMAIPPPLPPKSNLSGHGPNSAYISNDEAAVDGDSEAESDDSNADGEAGGCGEDLALERWRAVVELPPAPTVEELAVTVFAADAARGEEFRERFVNGRPPVEVEALAGGGGAECLYVALKRQRSARRAAYLSSLLGEATGTAGASDEARKEELENRGQHGLSGDAPAGQEQAEEPELDFSLDMRGARPPPSLSDWAIMVAYVTRMAQTGIDALADDSLDGPMSPTPSPLPSPWPHSRPAQEEGTDAGVEVADAAGSDANSAREQGAVSREVARSKKFEAFARGLGEAVKVCRMLQAAAQDSCLEGVDGFASVERTWADLRRSAREAAGDGDDLPSVFGDGDGGGEAGERTKNLEKAAGGGGSPGDAGSSLGRGGRGGRGAGKGNCRRLSSGGGVASANSAEAVREACAERAPTSSALCGISLQPLAVFGGGGGSGVDRSTPLAGVVEYCGVRYLASAFNLWVNVLDKPPPGALPENSVFGISAGENVTCVTDDF